MENLSKRRIGGGFLLAAGLWFGQETFAWVLGRGLDVILKEAGGMTFISFPWQNAIATGMAVVGGYLAFWPSKRRTPLQISESLGVRASDIAARLNLHNGSYSQAQGMRDPLHKVINDGISLLITFEKQGFGIPKISQVKTNKQAAFALLEYFSRLSPLLKDGHVGEAKQASVSIAEQAISNAL
jgi:hypothetical protein